MWDESRPGYQCGEELRSPGALGLRRGCKTGISPAIFVEAKIGGLLTGEHSGSRPECQGRIFGPLKNILNLRVRNRPELVLYGQFP